MALAIKFLLAHFQNDLTGPKKNLHMCWPCITTGNATTDFARYHNLIFLILICELYWLINNMDTMSDDNSIVEGTTGEL